MVSFFQTTQPVFKRDYHRPLAMQPKNWETFDEFDWSQNLIVEVGCGKGTWGLTEAKKNPQNFYIGIEKTKARSKPLLRESQNQNLPNHVAIRADAILLIAHKFPPASVGEFVFLYPNPWPKRRQANKRFFVGPAFAVFHQALKPNGKILVSSNIKNYVFEAKEFLEKMWDYQTISCEKIFELQTPRTPFEKKYQAAGEELFELIAVKK